MGGRPKKQGSPFKAEKRELSKQRMREKKARKEEKKELASIGMCRAPSGEVMTMTECGRIFGAKAWEELPEDAKEKCKEDGRRGWEE